MTSESENAMPPIESSGGLVERVKRILLEPKAEWPRIDSEQTSVGAIFRGWILILAAIPPIASFIGSLMFGYGVLGITYTPPVALALGTAVTQYLLGIASIFVLALVIDWLAPSFGGTRDRTQAVKVAAYSATAAWIAGIFMIMPSLAMLSVLVSLYSLYLLYLGLPRLMKAPEEKAIPYTVVTIIAAILLSMIAAAAIAPVTAMFGPRVPLVDAGPLSGTLNVPGGGSVDLGKLEQASKTLEAAAAQMEKGNSNALSPEALRNLLPASLGAYRRVEISSAGADTGGIGGARAEARYDNGDSSITLELTDMAAVGALSALGTAFNAQSSRETETGYEKTGVVDGKLVTESWDRQSGSGSYSVIVANRFMVEANGSAPGIDALKQAVDAVGIGKLEALAR
jgi:hypothetical protein